MSEDDQQPDEREVTTEMSAGLAGWLPVDLGWKRTVTARYQKRSQEFVDNLATITGHGRQDLAERLSNDETLSDATLVSAEKAARTSDAEFRRGLVRVLAAAFRDDARVDESAYLISVLNQLEPLNLRYVDLTERAQRPTEAQPTGQWNVTVEAMAPLLQISVATASSVAERLHALSLLTDRNEGEMVSWNQAPSGAFGITPFGRELLTFSRDQDDALTPQCKADSGMELPAWMADKCSRPPGHSGNHRCVVAGRAMEWEQGQPAAHVHS